MSQPPFEHAGSLRIGAVDFVSPDEIKVALDIEAPESVALNAGGPRAFPRVNSYLLIAVDESFLVGQIEWMTVERSAFPKRRGMQDFGLIDLPYPLRKLSLNPLGTLRALGAPGTYAFRRGADALPTIGAAVLLPTDLQLRAIVESGDRRRVQIGVSPLAADARVCVDPNRIFGRHLAVLGNTGSGKSCSVADLIRWSLEEARDARASEGEARTAPNARFIVLDPNGEYSRAFNTAGDKLTARIFRINPGASEFALKVPLWFWNSAEWSSFTQASAKTQRPLLRRALREVKAGKAVSGDSSDADRKLALRRYLSFRLTAIRNDVRSGAIQSEGNKFGFWLKAIQNDLESKIVDSPDVSLNDVHAQIVAALEATCNTFKDKVTNQMVIHYRPFAEELANAIALSLENSLSALGGIVLETGPDEDVPIPFRGTDLADHLESLAEQQNASQYLDFLVARLRTILSDSRLAAVTSDSGEITLEAWLDEYVGSDDASTGCVSVIDLSLVPTEVVHVITAVIARIVFEAQQRYVKLNDVALPTVLVMEEAHNFIKRYKDDVESHDAASVCCQVFERIAREGRKFGLGLVLSSQRPSELSPTVLSQCNTFLLHRISNDRDQELVHRLVPDNLKGLLRELPSLPSQSAILLGWASELPVMVKMNDLPKAQQPRSDDPDFWGVWVGRSEDGTPISRKADWAAVAADWQGSSPVSVETKDGE